MKVEINFFKAREKLPSRSGVYLVITDAGALHTLDYSKKHKKFNATDGADREFVENYALSVAWWAYINADLKKLGAIEI